MKTEILINRLKDLRDNGECVSETAVLEQAIKSLEAWDKVRAEIECLTITRGGEDYTRKMAELFALKIKVLQIIDKHLAEAEV